MTETLVCRDPDRTPIPESPTMRMYDAEDRAALACPATPLDGSTGAAQDYVDTVTRSSAWVRVAPPALRTPAAGRKIIVLSGSGPGSYAHIDDRKRYNGRDLPWMSLGTKPYPVHWTPGPLRPPGITDPWMVLHELTHFLPDSGSGHGRDYARLLVQLVGRFLGPDARRALTAELTRVGLRYSARRSA